MIVLVCGSRHWTDPAPIHHELDRLIEKYEFFTVMEGGAKGADRIASQWAEEHVEDGVTWLRVDAAWSTHNPTGPVPCRCPPSARRCRAAGPRRNQAMLDILLGARRMEETVGVLGFPLGESRGTLDMLRRARDAGVATKIILAGP